MADNSINASDGLETHLLPVINGRCYPYLGSLRGSNTDTSRYYAKNAGTVGINPQETLEKGIK